MMVQPGGSTTNGTATGTVSPSIQRIPLPGTSIYSSTCYYDKGIIEIL